jgi:hypothetical protein
MEAPGLPPAESLYAVAAIQLGTDNNPVLIGMIADDILGRTPSSRDLGWPFVVGDKGEAAGEGVYRSWWSNLETNSDGRKLHESS